LSPGLKKRLKFWTVEHEVNISEAVREAIELLLTRDNKVER